MYHKSLKCISLGIVLFMGHQIPPAFGDGFTFSQWIQMPKEWKRGYATAIGDQLTTVVIQNEAPKFSTTMSFKKCFQSDVTDDALVILIDNYISRHPAEFSTPMVGVATQAISEACAPYFQK